MLTLAIETSGTAGGIALVEEGRLLASRTLAPTGRRHARTLVAELQGLFDALARGPRECGCVAVSIGPGSFTGLRVGVVCARTLAYAVGCPVIAVDTLEAIAAGASLNSAAVDVVSDALREELFHARYVRTADRWRREGEVRIVAARELLAGRDPAIPLIGPGVVRLGSDVAGRRVEPVADWGPSAEAIARIGERLALAGEFSDLWRLEPKYIRRSAAEERAEGAGSLA